MCLFPPKPRRLSPKPQPTFKIREVSTSPFPARIEVGRRGSVSSFRYYDTFISSAEQAVIEQATKEKRIREAEKAELERYQAAERAEQVRRKEVDKMELDRLRAAETGERGRKAKEDREKMERLEKEVKLLRSKGRASLRGEEYDAQIENEDMELWDSPNQNQKSWGNGRRYRNQQRKHLLGEIDFVHSLSQKLLPPSSVSSSVIDQAIIKLEKQNLQRDKEMEDRLQFELNKIKAELGDIKLEGKLVKVKADATREGLKNGEARIRKEIEWKKNLERQILRTQQRSKRHIETSESDSEDSMIHINSHGKRSVERRLLTDRRGDEENVNLAALAKLPGRWNFAISSQSTPPVFGPTHGPQLSSSASQALGKLADPHETKLRDLEILKLHERIGKLEMPALPRVSRFPPWHKDENLREWEREREMERFQAREKEPLAREYEADREIAKQLARLEEKLYHEEIMKEKERQWQKELEDKEWKRNLLDGVYNGGRSKFGGVETSMGGSRDSYGNGIGRRGGNLY